MTTATDTDLQQHVTILGWLFILGHGAFLLLGVFVLAFLTMLGLAVPDPDARSILLIVGPAVGSLLIVLALPGLVAGYGLLTRKPWGRMLAMVIGILGLLNFPLGTAIGLYALWVLSSTRARDAFMPPLGAPQPG
jgi:hypothetical protein